QDQAAAHVPDVVDVFDVDGALLHARPAGDAVPHHLVFDYLGVQRRRLGRFARALGLDEPGPDLEEVVPKVHHDQLGGQGFSCVPRRTDALAPAALGTRVEVQDLLPREVLDRPGAEPDVSTLQPVEIDVQRPEPAPCLGVGEEDVQLRDEAVEMLGIGEGGEDPQYTQRV